jgi:preprotein translocase subunit SecG
MTIVLTIIHVIVCFFLVIVVLLQSGKAADLAGAFGGMGSQTAFGPRGSATVLSRATTVAAAVFMVTSLSLAILATRHAAASGSVLEQQKAAPLKPGPGQTAPAPTGRPSVTITPTDGSAPPKTIPLPMPGAKTPPAQQPAQQPPAKK